MCGDPSAGRHPLPECAREWGSADLGIYQTAAAQVCRAAMLKAGLGCCLSRCYGRCLLTFRTKEICDVLGSPASL